MSGRKKHKKHQRGQPPHQLLDELSSLRDLLGSDMEADIPLLDQVADPNSTAKPEPRPPQKPVITQRPLEEADLPILFSPIDEELVEEFTPQLSEADRELLRPLQNLPRKPLQPDPDSELEAALAEIEQQDTPADEKPESRKEFQPGLFDAPAKPSTEKAEEQSPRKPNTSKPAPAVALTSENPFLPPHIRARLTGGRVPKTELEPLVVTVPEVPVAQEEATPAPAVETTAAPAAEENSKPSTRERLIEQLVAEQLPELERQLRANIIAMVNEIYPEEA